MVKIYIASDHAGFQAKKEIKEILNQLELDFEDLGTDDGDISVDYPDFAKKVAEKVQEDLSFNKGILICGSGTGMQIAANKYKDIRAAFCYDIYSAQMARHDNDANILTLRSREFDHLKYPSIIHTFFETKFSNEERHINRIKKLDF